MHKSRTPCTCTVYVHVTRARKSTCIHLPVRPSVHSSSHGVHEHEPVEDHRKYPCRDYSPKPYRARASSRAQWGGQSRPEHRYSRLHGRSLRKSTRFCPNGFPFRCEKWRVRAAVISAPTHFCASDHACDFSRDFRARRELVRDKQALQRVCPSFWIIF